MERAIHRINYYPAVKRWEGVYISQFLPGNDLSIAAPNPFPVVLLPKRNNKTRLAGRLWGLNVHFQYFAKLDLTLSGRSINTVIDFLRYLKIGLFNEFDKNKM